MFIGLWDRERWMKDVSFHTGTKPVLKSWNEAMFPCMKQIFPV